MLDSLKNTVLFRRLSADTWTALQPVVEVMDLSTNTVVITAGAAGDSLYFIAEGSVLLQIPDQSGEIPLLVLGRGEYFGELSILQPGPRLLSAKTADNTKLVRITAARLETMRKKSPDAHWEFVQTLLKLHTIKARMTAGFTVKEITALAAAGRIGPGIA